MHGPTTLSEAVALLASRNGEVKSIAGGQSLMPMLAFRLAAPALLAQSGPCPSTRADPSRVEVDQFGTPPLTPELQSWLLPWRALSAG